MNFGQAIEELKNNKKVARTGWNGKGMWLMYVVGWTASLLYAHHAPAPLVVMKTADGQLVSWVASQADMFAEDWAVVG